MFNISSWDDRLLLMRALIDTNKEDTDEKMNKFGSKLDKIIAIFEDI